MTNRHLALAMVALSEGMVGAMLFALYNRPSATYLIGLLVMFVLLGVLLLLLENRLNDKG